MKPTASVSLDIDNQWSYMKTHGDAGWDSFPSYLDILLPRVVDFLGARNLKITFMVVGQDAALDRNHESLRLLATSGHEIGNHSFNHVPWLHRYSPQAIRDELSRAEDAIEFLMAGATAVAVGTANFYEPQTALQIIAGLREFLQRQGLQDVRQLVGSVQVGKPKALL